MEEEKVKRIIIFKWGFSTTIGVLVFILMLIFLYSEIYKMERGDRVHVIHSYSSFASEAGNTVLNNIVLLKGYLAYLETTELSEDKTIEYLGHLLGDENKLIRNVAVIEDTTIKWVYPYEGNESAIGRDLSLIEEQKDTINRIKKEHIQFIQGPVNLVQGGQGVIVRLPIIKEYEYYGQLSIVLDLEELTKRINYIAEKNNLRVHIVANEDERIVISNEKVLKEKPEMFMLDEYPIDWKVYAIPIDGWESKAILKFWSIIISLLLGITVGGVLYFGIRAHYDLENVANKDPLTGLYNRRFLAEYQNIVLNRADRYKTLVGFILIDLNNFKSVNDIYGHKAGDLVLINTAEILKKHTRSDEALFRLGGDEFLLMVPDLEEKENLESIKERILASFNDAFYYEGKAINIKPSMGISIYPNEGNDFDKVLHEADVKMYKNKPPKKPRV